MPTSSNTRVKKPPAWRKNAHPWRIEILLGPNMRHLGKRDKSLFGDIESVDALWKLVEEFGHSLGVVIQTFASDFEGELLKHVYDSAPHVDAYIVDPGGLTTVSQGWPQALIETRKPVVEVCFYNLVANNEISVFASNVMGRVMGMREHSYTAALLGLVLALDDHSFLNPLASGSDTARKDGKPYSFRIG